MQILAEPPVSPAPSRWKRLAARPLRRWVQPRAAQAVTAVTVGERCLMARVEFGSAPGVVRLAQVGARAVGKASHVCEIMVGWANERKQFNTKIGDFQMVQQMIADSVIEINAARWMVYHAAWMLDQGLDAREQIAMVKVHAAETLGRVVDRDRKSTRLNSSHT